MNVCKIYRTNLNFKTNCLTKLRKKEQDFSFVDELHTMKKSAKKTKN